MKKYEIDRAHDALRFERLRLEKVQGYLTATQKREQRLQQRLNRITNLMIGNERIWSLERLAMELEVEVMLIEEAPNQKVIAEHHMALARERVERLKADALFLRRLEWDLGELHTAVRGDTNRRGGRFDPGQWRGERP